MSEIESATPSRDWEAFLARNRHIIAFLSRLVDPRRHPARLLGAIASWSYFCFWAAHAPSVLSQIFLIGAVGSVCFYSLLSYQRRMTKKNRALTGAEEEAVNKIAVKCEKLYGHVSTAYAFFSDGDESTEADGSVPWMNVLTVLVAGIMLSFFFSLFNFITLFFLVGLVALLFIGDTRMDDAIASAMWVKDHVVAFINKYKNAAPTPSATTASTRATSTETPARPSKNKKTE